MSSNIHQFGYEGYKGQPAPADAKTIFIKAPSASKDGFNGMQQRAADTASAMSSMNPSTGSK